MKSPTDPQNIEDEDEGRKDGKRRTTVREADQRRAAQREEKLRRTGSYLYRYH